MDQMNRFYQEVFGVEAEEKCAIDVYRTWEEFAYSEQIENEGIQGFYVDGGNRVVTFDPTSQKQPLSALWETLFHEAAHQFTSLIAEMSMPAWLNEGTACYFEGARLRPSGIVETNLIPENRLRSLIAALERGSPTLEQVVSFSDLGSYPGEYYSVGWGLVYFLRNYEDEESRRVYLPAYRKLLADSGSLELDSSLADFVRYFIRGLEQPGVESLADFEKRFRDWIREIADLQFGPADRADRLLARADKQRANGAFEAAKESYQWALRKRPNDVAAHYRLGEVMAELGQKDGAVFSFRRALTSIRNRDEWDAPVAGFEDPDPKKVAKACLGNILKINRAAGSKLSKDDAAFIAKIVEAGETCVKAGFPRRALMFVDDAIDALGGDRRLELFRAKIEKDSEIDTRRWRRLTVEPGLAHWSTGETWQVQPPGTMKPVGSLSDIAIYREDPPSRYRFEVTATPRKLEKDSFFGLVFGIDPARGWEMVGTFHDGQLIACDHDATDPKDYRRIAKIPAKLMKSGFRLAVDVDGDQATVFLNDQELMAIAYDPGTLGGQVGLYLQEAEVDFSSMRIRY